MSAFLIVVGVGCYINEPQQENSRLKNLPTCEEGAKRVFEALRRRLAEPLEDFLPVDRIATFCTGNPQFTNNIHTDSPTEDNIKRLFEESLDRIGPADPLVLYWAGHGAMIRGQRDERRLFFSDTTTNNGRNLNFDTLISRLVSSESQVKSLVAIVDACASDFSDSRLPAGDMKVGSIRPQSRYAEQVLLFSASAGCEALGANDGSLPPAYTDLLLSELERRSDDGRRWSIGDFREAHQAVRKKVLEEVEDLAGSYGKRPETIALLLPFDFRVGKGDSVNSERLLPGLKGLITSVNAADVAVAWATPYESQGTGFEATWEARQKLTPYYKHAVAGNPIVEKWWDAGRRKDWWRIGQRTFSGVVVVLLFMGVTSLVFLLWGAQAARRISNAANVASEINQYSWPIQFATAQFLDDYAQPGALITERYERRTRAKQRARSVLALSAIGRPKYLLDVLNGPKREEEAYDPRARSDVILTAAYPAGVSTDSLVELLMHTPNLTARQRQGLILIIGQKQAIASIKTPAVLAELKDFLLDTFQTDDDPGVHSCAFWCLLNNHQFGAEIPKELGKIHATLRSEGTKRLAKSTGERHWYVDPTTGLTMAVLLVDGKTFVRGDRDETDERETHYPEEVRLNRSFAIAMSELSPQNYSNVEVPVQWDSPPDNNISHQRAEVICADLTTRVAEDSVVMIEGHAFLFREYGLPDELEWEYAARAGSTAAFCFGDELGADRASLLAYATVRPGSTKTPLNPFTRMPNDFGLFDAHGGVAELCSNDFSIDPAQHAILHAGDLQGVFRGGTGTTQLPSGVLELFERFPISRARVPAGYFVGVRLVRGIELIDSHSSNVKP